jgi:RNA polymerase sigma factor (sigma-70 family)
MKGKSTGETFTQYRTRLLHFILTKVSLFEDAEDILQDVFYQFSRINSLANPIENAAAWCYRVAKNRIIDHYRKKKNVPLPSFYDEDEDEYIIDEVEDILYGDEAGPETDYLRLQILEEIDAALADLPQAQREVFVLTEIDGLSVKEIAEKTGTPVNTVLSRKHYAVKHLRTRLQELYRDVMGGK